MMASKQQERWLSGAILLGTASSPVAALACPRCAAGTAARSAVWSEGFAFNMLAALAPFLVICAVSLWFERTERP
jgi:hypothetical protein